MSAPNKPSRTPLPRLQTPPTSYSPSSCQPKQKKMNDTNTPLPLSTHVCYSFMNHSTSLNPPSIKQHPSTPPTKTFHPPSKIPTAAFNSAPPPLFSPPNINQPKSTISSASQNKLLQCLENVSTILGKYLQAVRFKQNQTVIKSPGKINHFAF